MTNNIYINDTGVSTTPTIDEVLSAGHTTGQELDFDDGSGNRVLISTNGVGVIDVSNNVSSLGQGYLTASNAAGDEILVYPLFTNLSGPSNPDGVHIYQPKRNGAYALVEDATGIVDTSHTYGDTIDLSATTPALGIYDYEIKGITPAITTLLLPTGTNAPIGTTIILGDLDGQSNGFTIDAGTGNTITYVAFGSAGITIAQSFSISGSSTSPACCLKFKKVTATQWIQS